MFDFGPLMSGLEQMCLICSGPHTYYLRHNSKAHGSESN